MSEDQAPLPGPGPSLDRLVAAKMGYEWLGFTGAYGEDIGRWVKSGTKESAYDGMWRHETGRAQPQYSTSWEAAGEIVQSLVDKGYQFYVRKTKEQGWAAGFLTEDPGKMCSQHLGETAPLAIVLAFLALPNEAVKE